MTSWSPPPLPPRLAALRRAPLVGRRFELQTFEGVWAEVEDGRRQVVFVGGEPGAGKTRLAAEVAGALNDAGMVVLLGTSSAEGGVPYEPFAQMLDHFFANAPEGSLDDLLDDRAHELRRLSAHVARHRPGDGALADPGEVRRELFDAVAGFFRQLAGECPLALILDDLHWAQLPTMALLEHVTHACPDSRMLLLSTFRTTPPDRSDEIAARVAELHRLEGVRRLDLSGLDTDAIAEYVSLRTGLSSSAARASAAMLRDRTGGNPFLLRELWADLERLGGIAALRSPHRVPASIADALEPRLAGLGADALSVVELAAVLGDTFDLATLVVACDTGYVETMAFLDAAIAVGLVEEVDEVEGLYSFVHALARQAVLDRAAPSWRIQLHARAAQALEARPAYPSQVPRLAHHFLAARVLGFDEQALRYTKEAGRLAETGLAFEEAAVWFERAASLPECDLPVRAEMLFAAATNCLRAGNFPRARAIYDRLTTLADPEGRLAAAMGYEEATWRPGLADPRAVDLLSSALAECGLEDGDPRVVRASGSLGRALTFVGQIDRAREVGGRAVELAVRTGDGATVSHALTSSLWHGTTPEVAALQHDRTRQLTDIARLANDHETLGTAGNFRAMVTYLCGYPDELDEAVADARLAAQMTGQPYYRHISGCLVQAQAFMRGDFDAAARWAGELLGLDETFGDDMTEGPHGVHLFMINRETGGLARFRAYLDGSEPFTARWVPGLLALYTELGIELGIRRALDQVMGRDLAPHTNEATWPMELVFMTEAALALEDDEAVRRLRPLLVAYAGMNLASGPLIAVFGSADRYLGRVCAFLGDDAAAERHFVTALDMDRRMHSVVHTAETLARHAQFLAASRQTDRARLVAGKARALAEPIGQARVLQMLETVAGPARPDGLTDREIEVLRLLAGGLSNREIGARLHISANTAANHVRRILTKMGAANRTQAATYAADRQLI